MSEGGFAVTAYEPLRFRAASSWMYPHYLTGGKVQGRNAVNCRLILDDCTMSGETDGREMDFQI
ncbi:hypothetical protein [Paenibacillus sp. S150]|uniref:hypothetical protein n=1 Tax=Paenibacillus sp. S150 TaxID=2749826 RepID=UPI001C57755F|nr:hypothetical protein [Paenibacillus sp. S150]MBW4082235.1 hypothetical protein [Paenibacillus sp. S150]